MKGNQPPKWVDRLLEWYCADHYLEEVQGDLHEWFQRRVRKSSLRKARWLYLYDVIAYLRLFRIKKLNDMENNNNRLFLNYVKMATRQYKRNFGYAMLNLIGLTIGLLSTLLIAMYILDELSFDRFHEGHKNIYRLIRHDPANGSMADNTPSPWKPNMAKDFPEILEHTRMGQDPVLINEDGRNFLEEGFYWADDNFLEVFSFEVLSGDKSTMLDEPNAIVMTRSRAMRYFNSIDVVGKSLAVKVYDGNRDFQMKVTGVIEDIPQNSHIQFDLLGSMLTTREMYADFERFWGLNWMQAYVVLPDNVDLEALQARVPAFFEKNLREGASESNDIIFQPLADVRLHSEGISGKGSSGNLNYIYLFGFVALLVLLAASINYINLTTARSTRRGKEVGMRKVFGAVRGQVASQFYVECGLSLLIAFTLALGLTAVLLPGYNQITGKAFEVLDIFQLPVLAVMGAVFGLLLLLSGFYPAVVMNRFRPVEVLKGNLMAVGRGGSWGRKVQVSVQCAIAAFLISSTMIVGSQMRYFYQFDMGFQAEQLINIPVDDRDLQEQLMTIKDRMAVVSGVSSITASGEALPSAMNNTWGFSWPGKPDDQDFGVNIVAVDYDFFETIGTEILKGRNLSKDMPSDSNSVVLLNESAFALTGWQELDNQLVDIGGNERQVVGVVEDFHYNSLHSTVAPCAYVLVRPGLRISPDNLILKVEPAAMSRSLDQLDQIWREFSDQPFDFSFVDQAFAQLYGDEQKFMTVVMSFAGIGVFLAVLGLVSLVAFVAERRSKELSIRKVLGASRTQILKYVTSQFVVIFALSTLVALPLSRLAMESWLEGFANRVSIDWQVFVLSAVIALFVTILSIGIQAFNVASANPTRHLSDQ